MTDRPVPGIDSINEPFWTAASEGRLLVQTCADCDLALYPPRIACPHCFEDLEWIEASGAGSVYSYGLVHRTTVPDIFAFTPGILAVVELDEGARLVTNIRECAPDSVSVGMPVRVEFESVRSDVSLPVFVPD